MRNMGKKNKSKSNTEKWFDRECKDTRKKRELFLNLKHRDPNNQDLHLQYIILISSKIQTLKMKKEQHINHLFNTMEESINTNGFWQNWDIPV